MNRSLFQSLPDGERRPEEDLVALEEDEVPDPEDRIAGKTRGEEREEPLHREDVREGRLVARH